MCELYFKLTTASTIDSVRLVDELSVMLSGITNDSGKSSYHEESFNHLEGAFMVAYADE